MHKVIFSPKAEDAYLAILEHYYHFSIDFALLLEEKLDRLVSNLRKFKKLCPPSKLLTGIRRCVLTENISLVYQVVENDIHVISVYDSRTDHLF